MDSHLTIRIPRQRLAWHRLQALFRKEFYIITRDPIIFVTAILFPLVEMIIFAALFNINPRHLETTVVSAEQTPITRSVIEDFKNSHYYSIYNYSATLQEANYLLSAGKVQFILQIPPGFTRDIINHHTPKALLIADGSNPLAITGATSAVAGIANNSLKHDLIGPISPESSTKPYEIIVQQRYNPTANAKFYTLPNLVGLLLGLILTSLSALAMAKENNEGTMESLLTTPALPIEVLIAKMVPYIFFGFVQFILTLLIAHFIYQLPLLGNFFLLMVSAFFFICACIGVGIFFSFISKSSGSAVQMTSQFFALNVLFSGFFFPFMGMPAWAQWIGNLLPLTHFLKIIIAISLKGSTFSEVWPHLWPMTAFTLAVLILLIVSYKKTLD